MTKKRSVILLLFASLLLLLTAALSQTSAKSENQQFEDYTKQFFRQEVSGNTISLHYMLKNPTDYGIRKIPVTYGQCSTDTKAATASIQQSLEQLRSYDRANLSKENQLTYDVMEDSLSLSTSSRPVPERPGMYGNAHPVVTHHYHNGHSIRQTYLPTVPEFLQATLP